MVLFSQYNAMVDKRSPFRSAFIHNNRNLLKSDLHKHYLIYKLIHNLMDKI